VPKKTNQKKGTRVIWSCGLLCAPQSCLDFKNSLRSDSLKSFTGIFSGAQQMAMGKHNNHALQGAAKTELFGPGYLLLYMLKISNSIYI